MTVEQKDKILTALDAALNNYSEECEKRISEANGMINGAHYMALKLHDIIAIEFEVQESENEK